MSSPKPARSPLIMFITGFVLGVAGFGAVAAVKCPPTPAPAAQPAAPKPVPVAAVPADSKPAEAPAVPGKAEPEPAKP